MRNRRVKLRALRTFHRGKNNKKENKTNALPFDQIDTVVLRPLPPITMTISQNSSWLMNL